MRKIKEKEENNSIYLMIKRYIFRLNGVDIKNFIRFSLDIAEVYRLLFLWMHKYDFSYEEFNDLRYKQLTIINQYSSAYKSIINNKELLYKIIYLYLKCNLDLPIKLKHIRRIDYEKIQKIRFFYFLLNETKHIPQKCFDLWWDLT